MLVTSSMISSFYWIESRPQNLPPRGRTCSDPGIGSPAGPAGAIGSLDVSTLIRCTPHHDPGQRWSRLGAYRVRIGNPGAKDIPSGGAETHGWQNGTAPMAPPAVVRVT